jgi:hypothetical protein
VTDAVVAVLLVEVDDHLAVRARGEAVAARLQARAQLLVVVDLAVGDDRDRAVLGAQRLVAAGDVDDRQPPMHECRRPERDDRLTVGTAVAHRGRHPPPGVGRGRASGVEEGAEAAHARIFADDDWRAAVAQLSHAGLEPCVAPGEGGRLSIRSHGGRHMYRLFGLAHATLITGSARLRRQCGQGTVEYVALILLVALIMAGVVAAMKGFKTDEGQELGDVILGKIKDAVRKVEF